MEWTVHELAQRAGISSRTLRHYHHIGLLEPDRVGENGYRYYGVHAVARLHRVLLLRDTGMSLRHIADVLSASSTGESEIDALLMHRVQLQGERVSVERKIEALDHIVRMRREGREPQMHVMLQGFNDLYEDEVVQRWGRRAFEDSNNWWHSQSFNQQREWKQRTERLLSTWGELAAIDTQPDSSAAQNHAALHVAWFREIPGTPIYNGDLDRSVAMIDGVATMYETDRDFRETFGSAQAARLAAEALRFFARTRLSSQLR